MKKTNTAPVTKEQELKALAQIRDIVEGLGEDSYIGTALEGCLEIADENIRNDFACSMKQRYESASKEAEKANKEAKKAKALVSEYEKQIESLKRLLEREQEWKPYEDQDNVTQSAYESLSKQSDTRFLTDDEAKNLLYELFGFAKEKITIHHSVPKYEINRHREIRKAGELFRQPAYNSTDWNYIRFDCGAMSYELYDDQIKFYIH